MDGILITILIVTGFLIYKLISSSRKQEGYKRWKATGSGNTTNEETSKNKWEHGTWLRHALGVVTPKMRTCPVFDEEAVVWCANLLGIEVMRLKEILQDVSSHYREFWIRKRRGGYRMISAQDKELKAIQDTIYHRILLSVNVHPAATGFRRQHSIVDNVRPHLGKRCVLKTDIHDFFISIRSPRVKKTFEKIGYPKNISKVLGELCCMRRHLPQGASTSPVLSNIIAYEVLARVKEIIREEKFEPNHQKTRFLNENDRKIITGVSVSSGVKLTIPKARKREIRKNVYFILTKGLAEHQRRIGSHDPAYLKRLIGSLCYWRSIEPDNTYVADSIAALKRLQKGY